MSTLFFQDYSSNYILNAERVSLHEMKNHEIYYRNGDKTNRWQDESAIILKERLNDILARPSLASCIVNRLLYLFDLCYDSLNIDCSLPFYSFLPVLWARWVWRSIYRISPATHQRGQTLILIDHWLTRCSLSIFLLYPWSFSDDYRNIGQ